MTKLDGHPTSLPEIADLLFAIHECEHPSYMYMACDAATQQAHRMKLPLLI